MGTSLLLKWLYRIFVTFAALTAAGLLFLFVVYLASGQHGGDHRVRLYFNAKPVTASERWWIDVTILFTVGCGLVAGGALMTAAALTRHPRRR